MSITYVGGTGLANQLGLIFGMIKDINLILGTGTTDYSDGTNTVRTFGDKVANIFAGYAAAMLDVPAGGSLGPGSLYDARDSARSALDTFKSYLASLAEATLTEQVYRNADIEPKSKNLPDIMVSLIDDMVGSGTIYAADDEVDTSTYTATATAPGGIAANAGDGVVACATNASQDFTALRQYRPDGRDNQYLFAEVIDFVCTADKGTGATEGSEEFSFQGEVAADNSLAWDYPLGSGCSGTSTAVDASLDAQADGNLLTNSDFQSFTGNVPDNWTVLAGTPGTDILKNVSTLYTGDIVSTATLEFPEDGTPSLSQTFGTETDTEDEPVANGIYVGCYWAKKSAAMSAGALEVSLINSANAYLTNDAGHEIKFQLAHGTLTTSFAPYTWMWVMPKHLPSTVKFRIRCSTAFNSAGGGEEVFVSRMAFARADELYTGGVFARIFSGVESFAVNDRVICTVAKTVTGDFQDWFQRVFDMRSLGLQLPTDSGGGESIDDSLITG